jgi:hypothetical protein
MITFRVFVDVLQKIQELLILSQQHHPWNFFIKKCIIKYTA